MSLSEARSVNMSKDAGNLDECARAIHALSLLLWRMFLYLWEHSPVGDVSKRYDLLSPETAHNQHLELRKMVSQSILEYVLSKRLVVRRKKRTILSAKNAYKRECYMLLVGMKYHKRPITLIRNRYY